MHPRAMNFEEAFRITDTIVFNQTGKHLSDAQTAVIRGTWNNQSYEQIALSYSCTPDYLKQDVGPKLWKILSVALGEKVKKKNFQTVIQRQVAAQQTPRVSPQVEKSAAQNSQQVHSQAVSPCQEVYANPRQDWGEATDISSFYGRTAELTQLKQWIVTERCRLVVLLGMGGIGKTSISVKLGQQIQDQFEYLIWRSLCNAPPLTEILAELIQFLSDQQNPDLTKNPDSQISRLIEQLRQHRCLVILDNVESILQEENRAGIYCQGYEGYGELLRRVGSTAHQSCLVLTSREKPREVAYLEGETLPVRSLQVMGLNQGEGQELLRAKGCSGIETQWSMLIDRYAGNPLSLNIVATAIHDVLGGNISEFLAQVEQSTAVFGDIRNLLEQQLSRLPDLEREVMYWLAINREPTSLPELRKDIMFPGSPTELLESLESLRQRSLIEINAGASTQQPVVREYMVERFIEQIIAEIHTENPVLLMSHALMKAQAKDYIRESQIRVLLQPLVQRLSRIYRSNREIEHKLKQLILKIRAKYGNSPGYGAGNIINLCQQFKVDLAGYDFSELTIWQAYLQDAALQNVNFAGADLSRSVFAKTLGNSLTVAIGQDGILATGDADGNILLWQVADGRQLLTCQQQTGSIRSLAFSPDGTTLASSSDDQNVKLWNVSTGEWLKTWIGHTGRVNCLCFSPDGRTLASGSDDYTVRLWNVSSMQCLHILQEHTERVHTLTFSPDSCLLASGSEDQTVKLWDTNTGQSLRNFTGNSNWILAVAFVQLKRTRQDDSSAGFDSEISVRLSAHAEVRTAVLQRGTSGQGDQGQGLPNPTREQDRNEAKDFGDTFDALAQDSQRDISTWSAIASSSDDQNIKLWDINTGQCFLIFQGHTDSVWAAAFSPDGQILASSSDDQTIKLWQVSTGNCHKTLSGINSQVCSLAFSPDGQILASGNVKQTVHLWNANTGQAWRTLRGNSYQVWSVAFSPVVQILASGSDDQTVRLWDLSTGRVWKTLSGHLDWVLSVAFSPDGRLLASGSYDQTVKLWDIQTGECLKTWRGHTGRVQAVTFSPNGRLLASTSNDQMVKLWSVSTEECLNTLAGHTHSVWSIAFSPDSQILATGSYDQTVKIWDVNTGKCRNTLPGHNERVHTLTFSPDGQTLASGSYDKTVKLWDVSTGRALKNWQSDREQVHSVIFHTSGQLLVSGSDDQTVKLWNVDTGECLKTLPGHTSQIWSVSFSPVSMFRPLAQPVRSQGVQEISCTLASCSHDREIKLWNMETGECLQTLRTDKPYNGMNITDVKGITPATIATLKALGAIEHG